MPSITFKLSDPCYQYNSSIDEDSIHISVSGKSIKPWHTKYFTIFKGTEEWDGFGCHASINFIERVNRTEKLGITTESPFNTDHGHRDTISVSIFSSELMFSINLSVPPDTYQRLKDTNWSVEDVELTISNGLFGHPSDALVSGDDPNGYDLEWHVDRQQYQFIEDFYIRFFPISHNNLHYPKFFNMLDDRIAEFRSINQSSYLNFMEEIKQSNKNSYEISTAIYRSTAILVIALVIAFSCVMMFL